MTQNIFMEKSDIPTEEILLERLGSMAVHWQNLRNYLEEKYGPLHTDWKFYSKKFGWTLKLLRKKRNLFFFTALENGFNITFVFGDRAVAKIENSDLPKTVIDDLLKAEKYAEGRGLRLFVNSPADIELVKKLVEFKLAKV